MKKYLGLAIIALLIVAAFWLLEADFDAAAVDAKYSNSESQFFESESGARVHFRDQGNAAGPAMVLVHGSNASLHTWEPWIEILGSSYRIVTLDLPAHGLTGAVPDNRYGSAAQLATIAELTYNLGLTRFVLGGNSMGGGVSFRYALEHPQQIDALILVDASGLPEWRDASSQQGRREAEEEAEEENSDSKGPLAFRLLRKPWFRKIAAYLDTRSLTAQGLRSAFHNPDKVTDDMVERYYQLSMRAGTRKATLARFADFGSTDAEAAPTEKDLATLSMPALILWGETDAVIPVSIGERFASVLPNATLITYAEVGHIPMEEIPEKSAADVQKFLHAYLKPKRVQ